MLAAIHRALQRLIYERGNIDPREVEVSFEVPTRERIDRLSRPTLYVYLYDIEENLELRQANYETVRNNGRAMHRLSSRRFDLHYMISALTTNIEDEHVLLWRTLVTLVRHPQFPDELMDDELRALDPQPVGRIAHDDNIQRQFTIWNAMGVPPHPAFTYAINVPVDLEFSGSTPLVLTRTTRYSSIQTAHNIHETRHQLGGVIRNQQGQPLPNITVALEGSTLTCTTNSEGQFTLSVPSGSIQLRISREQQVAQVFVIKVPTEPSGSATTDQLFYNLILNTDPTSAIAATD